MFKVSRRRIRKLFTRKASKRLNSGVNKKENHEYHGDIHKIKVEVSAKKHVKHNIKAKKHAKRIDDILN